MVCVRFAFFAFFALVALAGAGLAPSPARAQGGEVLDASVADASPRANPVVTASAAQAGSPAPPPAASGEAAPRPARGPSVRERAGRRSRGGSAASGALMLVILIGVMGYYVLKRIRR